MLLKPLYAFHSPPAMSGEMNSLRGLFCTLCCTITSVTDALINSND